MNIAIIGGGASGIALAHLLDKKHRVTLFERQPILGGNIRTLGKNVKDVTLPNNLYIDNGVIEFDAHNFQTFHRFMDLLNVDLEEVKLSSALFLNNGQYYLSPHRIFQSSASIIEIIREFIKLFSIAKEIFLLILREKINPKKFCYNKPISDFLVQNSKLSWPKACLMYAYSIPYRETANIPASLAVPMLSRTILSSTWKRVKGGVYTYIEHILKEFRGTVRLSTFIESVRRNTKGVTIEIDSGEICLFDKVVFATPPHKVLSLLKDPTRDEMRRFSNYKANTAQTVIHTDTSIYEPYGVTYLSAFDMFQKNDNDAGYNAYLNDLIGVGRGSPISYCLAYNLEDRIDPDKIIHIQDHETPLYNFEKFDVRDEVIKTNGENHTYHCGAYLDDGLHEGAIKTALNVSKLLQGETF